MSKFPCSLTRNMTSHSKENLTWENTLFELRSERVKTGTHRGGNIVSCDVARPWQNAATLLRVARKQEKFLKIFSETSFVSATNVARVAKGVNI